ncbi:DUF4297 family anti-phage-associated protein [Halomonas llamarensis]|uniref:DUF4365 domain-containing protein n=1 Tax=Halomonas llamarensis TaxID=2945104 RepID=A0ABT0SU25_9GAMM|nr:DUF4297 family anti-phage-associated protein [Halomonas llamarensis]MCL7931345.1 hypothetical protein [Halomonas llamarensis]
MSTREAIDTITGYFYQFDKTILELLQQEDTDVSICIEGIEDIDIVNANETNAVQCKYSAKTEYNHSVIKNPIILMLRHFAENRHGDIKYHLYGHYKSGHEKLPALTCDVLKSNFLTYTKTDKDTDGNKKKITNYVHNELSLTDSDLEEFLSLLMLDIRAPSIEEQYEKIIQEIASIINVSPLEAELYHYNSALKIIRDLSIEQNRDDRYITKSDFLKRIRVKDEIFDAWFIKRKGREEYIKSVKREYLSNGLNMEPFDRFFLIDCNFDENLPELEEVVLLLANKWSKLSKRQKPKFCPSIYLNGLKPDKLIELKNRIYSKGTVFLDPYPFKGSTLCTQHFYAEPSIENRVKFKFVDTIEDLKILINESGSTVEIYQFYKDQIYFDTNQHKNVKIRIEDIGYIRDLTR